MLGTVGGVDARRWVAAGASVVGSGVGKLMPVSVAAPSAFLLFLLSLLFLLLPFFFPPSFEASSFPTSYCCCLSPPASGGSQGKVLELIFGSMGSYGLVRGKGNNAMR